MQLVASKREKPWERGWLYGCDTQLWSTHFKTSIFIRQNSKHITDVIRFIRQTFVMFALITSWSFIRVLLIFCVEPSIFSYEKWQFFLDFRTRQIFPWMRASGRSVDISPKHALKIMRGTKVLRQVSKEVRSAIYTIYLLLVHSLLWWRRVHARNSTFISFNSLTFPSCFNHLPSLAKS